MADDNASAIGPGQTSTRWSLSQINRSCPDVKDQYPPLSFSFEEELNGSRVYTRNRPRLRYSVLTLPSTKSSSTSWSFFSGLSLSDISTVSVVGLLISPAELYNWRRYGEEWTFKYNCRHASYHGIKQKITKSATPRAFPFPVHLPCETTAIAVTWEKRMQVSLLLDPQLAKLSWSYGSHTSCIFFDDIRSIRSGQAAERDMRRHELLRVSELTRSITIGYVESIIRPHSRSHRVLDLIMPGESLAYAWTARLLDTYQDRHKLEVYPQARRLQETERSSWITWNPGMAKSSPKISCDDTLDTSELIEQLGSILANNPITTTISSTFKTLITKANLFPDELSWIRDMSLAWEDRNWKSRPANEKDILAERSSTENFVENILGAELYRMVSAVELEEEVQRFYVFDRTVICTVRARLRNEIDQLVPLYEELTQLIPTTPSSHDMFDCTKHLTSFAIAVEDLVKVYMKIWTRRKALYETILEHHRRHADFTLNFAKRFQDQSKVLALVRQHSDVNKELTNTFYDQSRGDAERLSNILLHPSHLRELYSYQVYLDSIRTELQAWEVELCHRKTNWRNPNLRQCLDQSISAVHAIKQAVETNVYVYRIAKLVLKDTNHELLIAIGVPPTVTSIAGR